MNVSLQSINQPQLCEQMLDSMTRDDMGSLLIVTSTQSISVSSKLLQIFSPLYRDMLRDIPRADSNPVTIFIPDFEAMNVHYLFDLLKNGTITDKQFNLGSTGEILNLAKCFKIEVRELTLDMCGKPPPMDNNLRMSSPVPCESHDEKKSNRQDFQEEINRDGGRADSDGDKCTFCLRYITGGTKSSNNPTVNENEEVINIDAVEKVAGDDSQKCKKCSFCLKNFGQNSLRNHVKDCRVRKSMHLPFKCLSCGKGWRKKKCEKNAKKKTKFDKCQTSSSLKIPISINPPHTQS